MEPIIDASVATMRKVRALRAAGGPADFLNRRALSELDDRLTAVKRRFPVAATLHCLLPGAGEALMEGGRVDRVLRVEDPALLGEVGEDAIAAAPDTVPLEPGSLDLAVSILSLHEANDVPGILAQARRALKPDGLFLACMAGAGTLGELRHALLAAETELTGGASARVMPFADLRDAGALLQRAGFALPVADLDEVTVRYDTMFDLISDLRAMGATSALIARPRRPAPRRLFLRAAEIYAERFADPDGRLRATFNLVWLSGWAPSPTQQKPLRPGSAAVSLASVLGGKEKGPDS